MSDQLWNWFTVTSLLRHCVTTGKNEPSVRTRIPKPRSMRKVASASLLLVGSAHESVPASIPYIARVCLTFQPKRTGQLRPEVRERLNQREEENHSGDLSVSTLLTPLASHPSLTKVCCKTGPRMEGMHDQRTTALGSRGEVR